MKNQSFAKFLSMIDQTPGFIAHINADTLRYEYVNNAYETAFKLPRDKIIGSHIKEIIGLTPEECIGRHRV